MLGGVVADTCVIRIEQNLGPRIEQKCATGTIGPTVPGCSSSSSPATRST